MSLYELMYLTSELEQIIAERFSIFIALSSAAVVGAYVAGKHLNNVLLRTQWSCRISRHDGCELAPLVGLAGDGDVEHDGVAGHDLVGGRGVQLGQVVDQHGLERN